MRAKTHILLRFATAFILLPASAAHLWFCAGLCHDPATDSSLCRGKAPSCCQDAGEVTGGCCVPSKADPSGGAVASDIWGGGFCFACSLSDCPMGLIMGDTRVAGEDTAARVHISHTCWLSDASVPVPAPAPMAPLYFGATHSPPVHIISCALLC